MSAITKNTATTDYGNVVEYINLTKKQICQFLKVYFGEPVNDDQWNHCSFWDCAFLKTEQLHKQKLSKGEKALLLFKLEPNDEEYFYLKEWAYSKEGKIAIWTQESSEGGFTSFVTIAEEDKKSEEILDVLVIDPDFYLRQSRDA